MLRITYTSEAAETITAADVFRIIEKSAINNAVNDLTGFLIFRNNRFFQVIEGPREALDALMQRLERDDRHHTMRTLQREQAESRAFGNWRMKRFGSGKGAPIPQELARGLNCAPAYLRRAVGEFLA